MKPNGWRITAWRRLCSNIVWPASRIRRISCLIRRRKTASRAVRLVRSRAAEWGIDPHRIGIMGFSAGGELAAMTCNADGKGNSEASDPIDQVSARPDFQALIYSGPLGVRDQKITKEMNLPPTFIAVGDTDKFAPILTSHYLALREAGVSAELHIYAKTGHGFGFRDTNIGKPSNGFLQQFFDFLGARDAEKSVRAICLFQCRRRRQRHGGVPVAACKSRNALSRLNVC